MKSSGGAGSDPWAVSEVRHGMGLDLTEFVGRSREIAEVAGMVKGAPVVTVTGPSGIGKTRLALEVARRLHGDYSGGVWFVDLASITDPELVPQAAASAVGLQPEPGRDPLDALCTGLRPRAALLVLDNCEHLVDSCARLAERVVEDCNGISLLATSQQPLGISGERTEPLSPLSLRDPGRPPSMESASESEAVRLFCTRAMASHRGFRLTDEVLPLVVEICDRLDGIPLAIELAAARIAVLGPAEIAERIGERFRLLTQGRPGAPARHQTLRAALDWSYDLLTADEAAMFRRLSVFVGGAGLAAVEKVCSGEGLAEECTVDLLASLVARSLLVADTSRPRARYHMLETIRAYGRQRLEEAGEWHVVSCRHAAWCAELAQGSWWEMVGGDQRGLEVLEAEHDNLRAAMEWAVAADPGISLRLVTALTPFWETRGHFREGRQWLMRALDAVALVAHASPPPALHARALWGLGLLATLQGDVVAARPAVGECLRLARDCGSVREQAQALNLLGFISIFTQDPVAAKPLLEESVAMAKAAGDRLSTVAALMLLGRAHLFLSEVDQARAVFEECLASDHEKRSGAVIGLARTALAAGEEARARQLFEEVLPRLSDCGDRFETALVRSFLGELAWMRGDLTRARTHLEDGLELALAMGAPFPRVRCLYGLARVAQTEGDVDAAARMADGACQVSSTLGLPYALVRGLLVRAGIAMAAGDAEAAKKGYDDALATARAISDRAGVARSMHRLAGVARARGADDEAMALLYDAVALQAEIGNAGIPGSLEAMAELGCEQGRTIHAARLFGAAEALRQATGAVRRPDEVGAFEADIACLRSVLEPDVLKEAWAQGAALSRDEAVALALRGRRPRDPDRACRGWASLTPSERRIADLAAQGLSNREIGAKLFISDRTVQSHLIRVFPKMGVRSRRELRDATRQRHG